MSGVNDRIEIQLEGMPADTEDCAREIIGRIESRLPAQTRFTAGNPEGGILIRIRWPLGGDPQRPYKSSRIIELRVSSEVLDDYLGRDKESDRAFDAILDFVRVKLENFDPEHATPYGLTPPVEVWGVTSDDLRLRLSR